MTASGGATAFRNELESRRSALIEELSAWVGIPSIAGSAEHQDDIQRSARWLVDTLQAAGFPVAESWPSGAVWAEWRTDPQAPTVLVYSHHDVRAPGPEPWTRCAPFSSREHDGRLYGRGTSDAKGQVLAHLWATRATIDAGAGLAINLKLLIEAEEEIGSPQLADDLARRADRLAVDLVIVSDTMTWAAEAPAVCVSTRGRLQARLEVCGPRTAIHAGAVSGAAPNPAGALAQMLAGLHQADGRVALPGFYTGVHEPPDDLRGELDELPSDEAAWIERTMTGAIVGEPGRSLAERLWTRPAIDILTLSAGDLGSPATGTIPARASADIAVALAPGQEPAVVADLLRIWADSQVPPGVEHTLEITDRTAQPAHSSPIDHPALTLLRKAMSDAWGVPTGRMGNAGSGPGALLSQACTAPVLYFGTGLPEDAWHSADESVDLDVLIKGAATLAEFYVRLGDVSSQPSGEFDAVADDLPQ